MKSLTPSPRGGDRPPERSRSTSTPSRLFPNRRRLDQLKALKTKNAEMIEQQKQTLLKLEEVEKQ